MSNLSAFLTMIAVSEGTESIGDHGYNCLYGSTPVQPLIFGSYHDHPRTVITVSGIASTAAGRYQILARYYDDYHKTLDIRDFSPGAQDAIATQMVKECGALGNLASGDLEGAIARCASRWASLPGSAYGQHEQRFADLKSAFIQAGGMLA